jgi:dienelactone hydrolase
MHGLRDVIHRALGLPPHEVPIVADPGRFGVINEPECEAGYLSLVPASSAWRNRCPASVLVTSAFYRPIALAHQVHCPALIAIAEHDQLIPRKLIHKLQARLPCATQVMFPVDHFQTYQGEAFEEAAAAEGSFLAEHLLRPKMPSRGARRRAA